MKTVYVLFWTDCGAIYGVYTDKALVEKLCATTSCLDYSEHELNETYLVEDREAV